MKKFAIFLAAISTHFFSFSQTDTSKTLNEVVIQGNRIQIPFSKINRNIFIITKEQIEKLPVHSLQEILSFMPGVDVRQRGPNGSQADVGIDGGTFDQTLILINGMKITDPQTGHNMLNLPLPLSAIERIEVIRGAAARIYGINAMNGAINIITKKLSENSTELSAYAGSSFTKDSALNKTYYNTGISLFTNIVSHKVKQLFAVSSHRSNGYRYNTGYGNDKFYYQNRITAGKQNIDLFAGYVNNRFGANAFYAAPGDIESKEKVETFIAGISSEINSGNIKLTPRLGYRNNFDDYIYTRKNPDLYRNKHRSNSYSAELNGSLALGDNAVGAGIEARIEDIRSNSLGKHNRSNYGFYGEYNFRSNKRFSFNVGSYVNYNSEFGWNFLPGADAGFKINSKLRAYVNAGSAQRIPTYTDLFYKGPSNIGNPNLKPEKSIYGEAGLKYSAADIYLTANYFHRINKDFIDWVKDSVSEPWQPNNFQEIVTTGFSISAESRRIELAKNFILSGNISYTYLNPSINYIDPGKLSRYALDNLRNQFIVGINVSWMKIFEVGLNARYQERINYKDYILLNAKVSALINKVKLYAESTNIGNAEYVEAGAVPLPGRWITVGVGVRFD